MLESQHDEFLLEIKQHLEELIFLLVLKAGARVQVWYPRNIEPILTPEQYILSEPNRNLPAHDAGELYCYDLKHCVVSELHQ